LLIRKINNGEEKTVRRTSLGGGTDKTRKSISYSFTAGNFFKSTNRLKLGHINIRAHFTPINTPLEGGYTISKPDLVRVVLRSPDLNCPPVLLNAIPIDYRK